MSKLPPATNGILFKATKLHLERRYDCFSGSPAYALKFFGTAKLGTDRIALANEPDRSRKRLLFIAEASKPQAKRPPWTVILGFNAPCPKLGLGAEWYLQCSLPGDVFQALMQDYLDGRVNAVEGACLTNIAKTPTDKVIGVTWLIKPTKTSSASGSGTLTMLYWNVHAKTCRTSIAAINPSAK